MRVVITKEVQFDAGHRIPAHKSKCRNFHGHRYLVRAAIEGPVRDEWGASDDGMVADFGDLKALMMECIHDPLDHGFIVSEKDEQALTALRSLPPEHRTIIVPFIPTAENLAQYLFQVLAAKIAEKFKAEQFRLVYLDLYETPTSMARAIS